MKQQLKQKSGARSRSDEQPPPAQESVDSSATLAETDSLLADIDEILDETLKVSGETAEQFVNRYQQRGGQ